MSQFWQSARVKKKKKKIKEETENDETLKRILDFYRNGWPKNKSKVPDNIKFYYNKRNDIIENDGILFYNEKIMIPESMKREMLALLHESHFGMNKTKSRARSTVYWKNLNEDIENMILNCRICEELSKNNVKEPLIPHEIPKRSFEKVGCDIAMYGGKNYVVLVDYFSKWIELKQIRNKTSSEVIQAWMEIFAQFGIPKTIIADNMPFGSFECKKFAENWDIEIITSSPLYPKSNGMAERAVQVVKNILKKSRSIEDTYTQLLEYRNTCVKDMNVTPSQLVFNRLVRTKIPIAESLLEPKIIDEVNRQLQKKADRVRLFYDRSAKSRAPFKEGDEVLLNTNGKWNNAKVIKKWHTPRSYVVEDEDGSHYRRNSWFLRKNERQTNVKLKI